MKFFKKSPLYIFFILLFVFLIQFTHSFAETDIHGDHISADMTWMADTGPYIVYESPTIDAGAILTIEPGTIIEFDYGQSIIISGKLIIEGEPLNKVIFTSLYDTGNDNSTAYYGDWQGIKISAGGSYDIKNSQISYAGTALASDDANGTLDSVDVLHSQNGISLMNNSSADITNINIEDIISAGVSLNNSSKISMKSSKIKNVYGGGVYVISDSIFTFENSDMENIIGYLFLMYSMSTSSIASSHMTNLNDMIDVIGNSHIDLENSHIDTVSGQMMDLIENSSAYISNSSINNIGSGIEAYDNSSLDIESSTITNITSGGWAAFSIFNNSKANIVNSDIKNIFCSSVLQVFNASNLNFSSSTIKNTNGTMIEAFTSDWSGYGSTSLTVTTSTISDGDTTGLEIFGIVDANITNSKITNFLGDGIQVYQKPTVNIDSSEISGNNNGIESWGANLNIKNSMIVDNTLFGITNLQGDDRFPMIEAANNWWGNASGPFNISTTTSGTANQVTDNVNFTPWLLTPPGQKPTCCSNVLFIPGLEGSRLYKKGLISENQLWEPNWNNDVEKLYLDSNGDSLDKSIYTRDIIKRTNIGLGIFDENVYQSFSDTMDGLVDKKDINAWEAIPYDWRLDINTIISDGVRLGNGSKFNFVDELIKLANSSQTGKVTIVTHSNGGLIAKALINELRSRGESNLVDNIIMVAAPQLGTPEAVASMLHGDGQEIAGGYVLSKFTARKLGENMMSAYNLLPQAEYFNKVSTPVIVFDPSIDKINDLRSKYGNTIDSFAELRDFLLGVDGRAEMDYNIDEPAILKTNLFDQAENNHNTLDTWIPPDNIKVIQLAGWGVKTLSGIRYITKKDCTFGLQCTTVLDRQPIITEDGDGVVLVPSATTMNLGKYYIDLKTMYDDFKNKIVTHANIFEATSTIQFITNTVLNITDSLPEYITTEEPTSTNKTLELALHSPVSIDVYNANGDHTGLADNPNSNSDLQFMEQNIPGSRYMDFGEGKYVFLDDGASYNIKLHGLAVGIFTLEAKTLSSRGETINESQFEDIPTSPHMEGNMLIDNTVSSSTVVLDIDANGDSIDDFHLQPGQNETIPAEVTSTKPIPSSIIGSELSHVIPQAISISQPNMVIQKDQPVKKILPIIEKVIESIPNDMIKISNQRIPIHMTQKNTLNLSSDSILSLKNKNDLSVATTLKDPSDDQISLIILLEFIVILFTSYIFYRKNRN